jgi:hypothetical protein
MRIICEICKQVLQQLGNYYRVRHYNGKAEYGKSKFYYHQQTPTYVKALIPSNDSSTAGKTLIKVGPNEFAETVQVGVQAKIEHQTTVNTGLEQQNICVRDSPSLVWGRPAKSVVERPRGFNSHIPRHFRFRAISVAIFGNYSQITLRNYCLPPTV